jgi:hypothetical protein
MALTKRVIIGIVITIIFLTVALILGLIPVYMRHGRQTTITSTINQTSTTKTTSSTTTETTTPTKMTDDSNETILPTTIDNTTSWNQKTTTTTSTSTNTVIATSTSTIMIITTTIDSKSNSIASTTTTNNSNSAVSITAATMASDVSASITTTKPLISSEGMMNNTVQFKNELSFYFLADTSGITVSGTTKETILNTSDVLNLTKSISVLTTSGMYQFLLKYQQFSIDSTIFSNKQKPNYILFFFIDNIESIL